MIDSASSPCCAYVLVQGVAVAVPLVGGIAGSVATADQINSWYKTINKPSWTPPVSMHSVAEKAGGSGQVHGA